jgi:ribose transport system permease protein
MRREFRSAMLRTKELLALVRARLSIRDLAIIGVLIALFVTLSVASPAFLSERNLLNILDQNAAIGIMAIGATVVVIAGGLDLSIGAIYGLAGVLAADTANQFGAPAGFLVGILVGAAAGACNGSLVVGFGINSLLATLGSGLIIGGLAVVSTEGFQISVIEPDFTVLGQSEFLGASYAAWIFGAVALAAGYMLQRTRLGRHIYAIGGNVDAARLSGVRVGLVVVTVFVVGGLTAGLAGTIGASRVSLGAADAGTGLLFPALAAVFVGGSSIYGGEGAIWRTVVGLHIIALMNNGFNLLNLSPLYQPIVQGTIILAAVGFDAWSRRDSRRVTM